MAFEGSSTFVLISFQGKPLNLDTGAEHADLYPAFAKAFPDVVASGKKGSHTLTGVGGSANFDSVVLPSLTFQVGGSDVNLRPAYVMLKQRTAAAAGSPATLEWIF